jgi:GNAT superfamily N-acetyltransferase
MELGESMQAPSKQHAVGCADIAIRMGSIRDIDLLKEIDDDASVLFERAGLRLDVVNELEVATAERNRWLRCLGAGTVLIAIHPSGQEVGFAAVGLRDSEPYLDQLSVRCSSMGRGIGTELLNASITLATRAGGRALWLTTYSHLSWNRPFYERHGFVLISPEGCGEELQRELLFERRFLPQPEERVVMRRDLAAAAV